MFKKACIQCESPNLEVVRGVNYRSRIPIVNGVPQYQQGTIEGQNITNDIIVCRDCGRGHEYELDENGRIIRMALE